jgi:transcriptional regulator with XRE-family HTH domain
VTQNRSSRDFGKRLTKYRKLAGMTAQQLSDALGGELSRSVIANIESGRKSDVTVDQLLALAWALGVPPAILALPVEDPYAEVLIVEGERRTSLPAYAAVSWMNFTSNAPEVMEGQDGPAQAGYTAAREMLAYADALTAAISIYEDAAYYAETDPEWKDDLISARKRLEGLHKDMRRAGMNVQTRLPKVAVHGND